MRRDIKHNQERALKSLSSFSLQVGCCVSASIESLGGAEHKTTSFPDPRWQWLLPYLK